MPAMRTAAPIRTCIAALLLCTAAPGAHARDPDPALAAIVRHPQVEARLRASGARLVWMPLAPENGHPCYALQESHPTHNVTVGQYCFDRRASKVLAYDVVNDRYTTLP
jgi:hypothetical protein